ncbi:MAG: hypothetical protein NC906_06765 [Candidatus Omnitrophica bacterium]|nr:hypothetical protein [Candidatus Omnitrophota bacterium]MCM8816005.1 hypothetical protein [Candidatus Omnitrophota bacterium]
MTLEAMVTEIARKILFAKLSLTAIFDQIAGKSCIEMFVDFQNKKIIGYPTKVSKKRSVARKSVFMLDLKY